MKALLFSFFLAIFSFPALAGEIPADALAAQQKSQQARVWLTADNKLATAVSADGKTWQQSVVDLPVGCASVSAPQICVDAKGFVHIAYLAEKAPGAAEHRSGVYVSRSIDGGKTWRTFQLQANGPFVNARMPQIACDNELSPAGQTNHVYVVWILDRTRADGSLMSHVMFSRSTSWGNAYGLPAHQLSFGYKHIDDVRVSVIDKGQGHVMVDWYERKLERDGSEGQTAHIGRKSFSRGMRFGYEQELQD